VPARWFNGGKLTGEVSFIVNINPELTTKKNETDKSRQQRLAQGVADGKIKETFGGLKH